MARLMALCVAYEVLLITGSTAAAIQKCAAGLACAAPTIAATALVTGSAAAAPALAVWAPTAASSPPYVPPTQLSAACKASAAAGLDALVAAPGYDPAGADGGAWGPPAAAFPPVPPSAVPAGCNADAWAQWRLLGAAERIVAQGFCYCHHHAPWWLPPARARAKSDGSCAADCVSSRAKPYQGVDCSNYSAYLYNLALGRRFGGAIGAQACAPGRAPGRVLPYTADQQHLFRPGDLLFITVGLGSAQPGASSIRVSHVVLWTGAVVDFDAAATGPFSWAALLANTKPSQRAGVRAYAEARRAAGRPVYVITDSHWMGPDYRPFAGWYVSSFSHARRLINPDPSLPAGGGAAATYSGTDCMSALCCSARGA